MPETTTASPNVRRSARRRANAKAKREARAITTKSDMTKTWFTGSNGNLFCDAGAFRYCIARQTYPSSATYDYSVARNGQLIARTPSFADAKRIVQLDSLKAEEGDA